MKNGNWITKLIDYTFSGLQGFHAIRQAFLDELKSQAKVGNDLVNVWLDTKTSKAGHLKITAKFSNEPQGAAKKPYPKTVYDPIFALIEVDKKEDIVLVDRNGSLAKSDVAKAIIVATAQFAVRTNRKTVSCADQNEKHCQERVELDSQSVKKGHFITKMEAKANAKAAKKAALSSPPLTRQTTVATASTGL